MNTRRTIATVFLLGLAACGGATEEPVPATIELGYGVPGVNPVTYTSADTAQINIELQPGMPMEQSMGTSSRVRLTFEPTMGTAGNLRLTAAYEDFSAFAESPMAGRQDVGAEAVQGDFVLSLTPEGVVEQVSGPELPEAVREVSMGGDNLFADFFLRLPDRVVTPGESWTDTVSMNEETEEASTTNETIIVSTFRGDTLVGGRRLWIIDSNKTTHVLVEGAMQGMEMRNELNGSVTERSLWDPTRRLLHSSTSSGTMTGTVSIPGAGMNDIPLNVTNRRYIRLVEAAD